MTTDAAVAEPEAPEAEAPPETTQEAPPTQGDAASPQADAAPAIPDADIDAAFQAYQQESKEGEPEQPEPRAAEPQVDPEYVRHVQERRQRFTNEHQTQQQELDSLFDELVEAGVDPIGARRIVKERKDRLNNFNAVALSDAGFEAAYNENAAWWRGVQEATPQSWHSDINKAIEDGKLTTQASTFKFLLDKARAEGEASGTSKGKELGFKDGFRRGLQRQGEVANLSSDGQQVNGAGGGGGKHYSQMSAEERSKLTPEQRDAAVARERQARGA